MPDQYQTLMNDAINDTLKMMHKRISNLEETVSILIARMGAHDSSDVEVQLGVIEDGEPTD